MNTFSAYMFSFCLYCVLMALSFAVMQDGEMTWRVLGFSVAAAVSLFIGLKSIGGRP